MVDDYSRFPFAEPVSSTSASAVIPKLDQLLSTFGASRVVKSDNGPQFNGEDVYLVLSIQRSLASDQGQMENLTASKQLK